MKTIRVLIALMFVPLFGWAQGFANLDEAVAGLNRGFEGGDAQAIVSGISEEDKVMLSFPGIVDESGFFGRDQASYLLEKVFSKVQAVRFQQVSAKKNSAEAQYNINASWTVKRGGNTENKDLYIVLRSKGDRWSIVSIRSGS